MTDLTDSQQLREQAKQAAKERVDRFVRRFDESYRLLAYHAALPLVLTPELVNYLRNEFLRGEQVPWVAEVDLLLSDLCSQVGYELYAMDTHVREYLLEEMQQNPRFGKRQMQKVAQVLYSYVSYLSRLNPGRRQKEIEAQRWAAMVYLGDEQCKQAAREIAHKLIETSSGTDSKIGSESGIRAELARLTRITEELSSQLQEESSLLEYAKLVQRILRTPDFVTPEELNRSYQVDEKELTFPQQLLPTALAQSVQSSRPTVTRIEGFPEIKTFKFEIGTINIESETKIPSINLQSFEFEIATIELKKTGLFRQKTELIIKRNRQRTQCFIEDLGNGVELEMVAIPEGSFLMGSPADEPERYDDESPQHQVNVPAFFMGKYPITQAQWQAVASLPQVNRQLDLEWQGGINTTSTADTLSEVNRELEPDPSNFKGANRPVERVSWYDAVEFCSRLSQYTGKNYRLPSEAEWEYACRAGTTTPFHFGETITSELANYDATKTYGAGVKGTYREETTEVGSFGVANAFGLYDMHGNVWEWCLDDWHDNYEGAPEDGSAWFDNNDNDNLYQKQGYAVLRGGSWPYDPYYCRSASRDNYVRAERGLIVNPFGFRVVCGVGRILR